VNNLLNRLAKFVVVVLLLHPFSSAWSDDADANSKRGRVYFKMVCTVCHIQSSGKAIPPNTRTMDEWRAYMDAGKHDAGGTVNPSLRYYMSKGYRESIKDTNKAAGKFLDLSDEQVFADVRKFAVTGAKDSDTPASCE